MFFVSNPLDSSMPAKKRGSSFGVSTITASPFSTTQPAMPWSAGT